MYDRLLGYAIRAHNLLKIRLCRAESGLGFLFFLLVCLRMCSIYTQTRLIQEHLVHNTLNLFLLRDSIHPTPEKFPETSPP